jgi:hypothetical protein
MISINSALSSVTHNGQIQQSTEGNHYTIFITLLLSMNILDCNQPEKTLDNISDKPYNALLEALN